MAGESIPPPVLSLPEDVPTSRRRRSDVTAAEQAFPVPVAIVPETQGQPSGEVAGFRSGTHIYRKLYDMGDIVDRVTGKLLGPESPSIVSWQENVAQTIADLRLPTLRTPLVTTGQIEALAHDLEPGDLILERQEGYLSNLAMPGFWKHSSIHVGTPELRRTYFDSADVQAWVRRAGEPSGCFETLLARRYPHAHAASKRSRDGRPMRAIESTADGVVFKALEETCAVDSLATLRPRLSKVAKAKAIARAFGFVGLPYDYRFDFTTDDSFICSELVYKCFRSRRHEHGLHLRLRMISGRLAMPTNDIAHFYAEHFSTHGQQLDLVGFLDGDVKKQRAFTSTEESFRESHARRAWRPHSHGPGSQSDGHLLSYE